MSEMRQQHQFIFGLVKMRELAVQAMATVVSFLPAALILLVVAMTTIPHAEAQTCETAFLTIEERLARLPGDFQSLAELIRSLPTDLINGERTPTWQDLTGLDSIIQRLRKSKERLTTPEQKQEFDAVAIAIAQTWNEDPKIKGLATAHRWYQPTNRYKPTEYKLKLEYQKLLGKLNHELPRGARIPIQRLPVDLRRTRLNQDAREFMAEFEQAFERRFPTTGYKTYEEYEAYLRSSDDPHIKKAIEMIDKNQIEVVIRRPESGRFWVPKVGFQNQYVTGTSKGWFGPHHRKSAEQRLYDLVDETAYLDQDPEFMPKYGTFRPAPDSGVLYSGTGSSQYGSDFYVIRLSDIQDRLSFTPNDSLQVGGDQGPLTHWSGSFIPWKYRFLMVEFMRSDLEINSFSEPSPGRWRDLLSRYHSYWETQILGAVDLSNVESFQFTQNPPSGAFLRELMKRNIPIYDAQNWPPVKWTPPESEIRQAKEGN
jgi:hypothetical protein